MILAFPPKKLIRYPPAIAPGRWEVPVLLLGRCLTLAVQGLLLSSCCWLTPVNLSNFILEPCVTRLWSSRARQTSEPSYELEAALRNSSFSALNLSLPNGNGGIRTFYATSKNHLTTLDIYSLFGASNISAISIHWITGGRFLWVISLG